MSNSRCAFCLAVFPTTTARMNHEQNCDVHSVEKVHWYECKNRLPDDETSVLIFGAGCETCEGFHEADKWFLVSGIEVVGEITHWAPMPMGPFA